MNEISNHASIVIEKQLGKLHGLALIIVQCALTKNIVEVVSHCAIA